MAFLFQSLHPDRSAVAAVDRVNSDRVEQGLSRSSSNTGNYVKARQRLLEPFIMRLAKDFTENLESEVPKEWLWKGRNVRLIDGTTILMADSPENQEAFPQHGQQEEGSGFPIARLVALISLATGLVTDFAMGPYQGKETGEMALARQVLSSLKPGDIVVADRYYCSYFFIAFLKTLGVDLVSRLHGARTADFRSGKRLSKGDHLVVLEKPPRPAWMDKEAYAEMPETITVREIKAKLDKPHY